MAGERPAGLHWGAGVAPDRQVELDDLMGVGEGGFEVALALADDVGFGVVAG